MVKQSLLLINIGQICKINDAFCEFVQFLYVWFALAGQWMPLFYVVSSDIFLCLGLLFFCFFFSRQLLFSYWLTGTLP